MKVEKPGFKLNFEVTRYVNDVGEEAVHLSVNLNINLETLFLDMYPQLQSQYDELDSLSLHLLPIVVGAFVETGISEVIAMKLVLCDDTEKLLDQDGMTYANKVRLMIALGLLPENMGRAARQLGRVRNKFAHKPYPSPSDPAIKSELWKLIDYLIQLLMTNGDKEAISSKLNNLKLELAEKPEEFTRRALKLSWLILAVMIEKAKYDVTRLEPLPDTDPYLRKGDQGAPAIITP